MPPALIAAGVGAAASIGGAIIGGNSTKKAAQQAADTSLQVANTNNALARDIYGQNQQALSPFMQRGNAAGDQINALLGLGGAQAAPAPQPQASYAHTASPMAQNGYFRGDFVGGGMPRGMATNDMDRGGQFPQYGNAEQPQAGQSPQPGPMQAPQGGNSQADAFQRFRDSTGYQFRLGEGTNALTSQFASGGALNSGAAAKALTRFGQDYGSNEFGKYMGYLGGQQATGLAGASALAGVGQNYAGLVTANNNLAGESASNAALMRGAANANMWNGIGSGVGNLFGSSFGSIFGKGK
jgi:hypothetical protein